MSSLLRVAGSVYDLILNATPANQLNVLLAWLVAQGIALVTAVPEVDGLYCVQEVAVFKVYQSVWNASDGIFQSQLVYTLQWLSAPV